MKNKILGICLFSMSLFACETEKEQTISESNEWELVIVDSIQVDYLGTFNGGEFTNGIGLLFNFKENKLLKFDEEGNILYEESYPKEGPGKVFYPTKTRITKDGKLYAASFVGWLYEFNQDLTFKREINLEFLTEAKDGGGIMRTIDEWRDYLILYYPGRDGANPYDPHFIRDHYLLEKVDPETGKSEPIIKIPPISRYASDAFYERPWIHFSVLDDLLYLILDNEPLIHIYDLSQGDGKFLKTIPISPSKFMDNGEHSEKYQYISGSKMLDGSVRQVFPTQQGIAVYYTEGINEDVFMENELFNPDNFSEYPNHQRQILKIVQPDSTLSNEISIPYKIQRILNIESLDKPFYALRHDEYLGEEQDYLTFYKLQLKQK